MTMPNKPASTSRMPTIFIPHGGGPCFFMDWNPPHVWDSMRVFLEHLAASLPTRPRAILLVSAHWEAPAFTVGSGQNLPLIYDYYGFPPHTYELTYPAPGDPALAERVRGLLAGAGLAAAEDVARGYDHGVFIPLKLVFPDADIPVVQLSLRADYDPEAHIAAGRALAPLRDEGVLILGSGMSFHNLPGMRDAAFMARVAEYSDAFDAWLTVAATDRDTVTRNAALADWTQAPFARQAHPPRGEDHLLPLFVAAGAAGEDVGARIFSDHVGLGRVSAFRFG